MSVLFLLGVTGLYAPDASIRMAGTGRLPGAVLLLGPLPGLYGLAGPLYLLGGVLFGIATFRARVFPRLPAVLLALGAVLPLATSSFVVHPYGRYLALPVGLALAWLGFVLFSERKTNMQA